MPSCCLIEDLTVLLVLTNKNQRNIEKVFCQSKMNCFWNFTKIHMDHGDNVPASSAQCSPENKKDNMWIN